MCLSDPCKVIEHIQLMFDLIMIARNEKVIRYGQIYDDIAKKCTDETVTKKFQKIAVYCEDLIKQNMAQKLVIQTEEGRCQCARAVHKNFEIKTVKFIKELKEDNAKLVKIIEVKDEKIEELKKDVTQLKSEKSSYKQQCDQVPVLQFKNSQLEDAYLTEKNRLIQFFEQEIESREKNTKKLFEIACEELMDHNQK